MGEDHVCIRHRLSVITAGVTDPAAQMKSDTGIEPIRKPRVPVRRCQRGVPIAGVVGIRRLLNRDPAQHLRIGELRGTDETSREQLGRTMNVAKSADAAGEIPISNRGARAVHRRERRRRPLHVVQPKHVVEMHTRDASPHQEKSAALLDAGCLCLGQRLLAKRERLMVAALGDEPVGTTMSDETRHEAGRHAPRVFRSARQVNVGVLSPAGVVFEP